jgi:hypothetical protein
MWYFGKPLHFSSLSVYGNGSAPAAVGTCQYKVEEEYNSYHGSGWLFGKCAIDGYDYSGDFWRHVCGPIYCGGIAGHSYGQANIFGYRDRLRLEKFSEYLRRKESGRLRKSFERLAHQYGMGESAVNRDSCAQTSGRVDGVVAALNIAEFEEAR